jgi:hypothetical protein
VDVRQRETERTRTTESDSQLIPNFPGFVSFFPHEWKPPKLGLRVGSEFAERGGDDSSVGAFHGNPDILHILQYKCTTWDFTSGRA